MAKHDQHSSSLFLIIAKNKPDAHHKMHLHTIKVYNVHSFTTEVFGAHTHKKETPSFLESRSATASFPRRRSWGSSCIPAPRMSAEQENKLLSYEFFANIRW